MKLMTTGAFALAAAAVASPLAAQSYSAAPAPRQPAFTPATPGASAAVAQPTINISKKAAKAFIELQNAVNANDFASIPAKAAAANAVAQTKEDRYAIAQMQLKAAVAAKDNVAAGVAVDAIGASGYVDSVGMAKLYDALGVQHYNAKDFARAATLFERASTLDPRSVEAFKLLGEARNASGQKAEGAAALTKAIQLTTAAGQKPGEDLYKRAVVIAYEAKLPSAVSLGREWIAAYPSPDSWRNATAIYRNITHPNVQGSLDLLRLMRATGGLTTSGDYMLMTTAAAEQGNFGEAQSVLDEGLANQRIATSDASVRDLVTGLKGKPKPTEADLQAASKMAATGASLLRVGDRYYGLGNYARAAELYRQGIAKGGADAGLANLHLGMALARAGDKAGAATALNAVTGANAEIAKYWLLYVNRAG